ncbi:hypothetical protein DDF67_17610 [Caulobacter endophyticus]|uniref:Uncharacterized protein n=1 Tax=Caulobacter endophyticus TaxID=2172652 RepID=A0A2T9JQ39_9CAUL|nr:hypothetical protein [Caulobacter endophyticus]PVM85721.1 hypothetical protein DDF67_17610 [Caulobacter endophyticus]
MIDLLLKNGADPNVRDKAGATPLICATEEAAALALIKGGAAIDAPSATCVFGAPATIDDLAAASHWTQVQALLAQRRGRTG